MFTQHPDILNRLEKRFNPGRQQLLSVGHIAVHLDTFRVSEMKRLYGAGAPPMASITALREEGLINRSIGGYDTTEQLPQLLDDYNEFLQGNFRLPDDEIQERVDTGNFIVPDYLSGFDELHPVSQRYLSMVAVAETLGTSSKVLHRKPRRYYPS